MTQVLNKTLSNRSVTVFLYDIGRVITREGIGGNFVSQGKKFILNAKLKDNLFAKYCLVFIFSLLEG